MKKLFVTITIDTENPQNALVKNVYHADTLLLPKTHNYGTRFLLKLFEHYDVHASWFLDIYEEYLFGDKYLGRLCELLRIYKQDIQLHTHPVWLMDRENRKKVFMNQYTLEEQIHILETGGQEIYRLSGIWPSAHRGGAYGVDANTLRALEATPIKVDSSLYKQSANCKIRSKYNNCIHNIGNIMEMPVSVYEVSNYYIDFCKNHSYCIKSDINYSSLRELILCCEKMIKNNGKYLNIFMHSFSLYEFFKTDITSSEVNFTPEQRVIKRLVRFLEYACNKPEIEIVTIRELERKIRHKEVELDTKDYMPVIARIRG